MILESQRKHIQRFLTLKEFSLPLFWFPLVKKIRENLFSISSELVLILDRSQWQNTNILMISLAWKKREIPLYWKILTHKGASNLTEQKAVISPVIRLLKGQRIIITADREFHKTGGYNLESAKANEIRLNNLILLISISYIISSFQVQKVKNKGVQEYISRTNEKGREERRHSSFFVGLSMIYWAINDDFH